MVFSDKFQTINLHEILKLTEIETQDPENDLENEITEEKIEDDNINTISDNKNQLEKVNIDLNKLEKTN